MLLVTLALGTGTVRLVQLQLIQGRYYRQLAEENRIRFVPVPSDRGVIRDREGRQLASNRLARSVYLWPRSQSPQEWQVTAERLSEILDVSPEEIVRQLEERGYQSQTPVRVSRDISRAAFVALAEQVGQVSGVEIRGESNRFYPHGTLAAHVLGYIGEATERDLQDNPQYPMGMIVGKMGLEESTNEILAGVWGNRLIEVNAHGEELRELGVQSPEAGSSLTLTLDLELQKTAERTLADRRGGVAVVNVNTGEVLALASGPSFDPNLFTRKVSDREWKHLQRPAKPFLNRALQGYPPGSTFKIVTAVAGMESGNFSPGSVVGTSSYITVGGTRFHEHSGGYGVIGFRQALAYSSNTFFYQVGLKTGPEPISKWAGRMGIGTTDLELLGLEGGNRGSVPTPEEKEELYNEPWYGGDTVSMSIGQGLVLATPLELAVMVATIANGGLRVKPHLLSSQTNTSETQPEETGIDDAVIQKIQSGLIAVVKEGTARSLNDGSIPLVAGKTGTSEVVGQKSHSVFVAYGPAEDPQIAIAAVVENGGYGSVAAAPIAHEIFKTYFNGKKAEEKSSEE